MWTGNAASRPYRSPAQTLAVFEGVFWCVSFFCQMVHAPQPSCRPAESTALVSWGLVFPGRDHRGTEPHSRSARLHSPRPHRFRLKEHKDPICAPGPLSGRFQAISKQADSVGLFPAGLFCPNGSVLTYERIWTLNKSQPRSRDVGHRRLEQTGDPSDVCLLVSKN